MLMHSYIITITNVDPDFFGDSGRNHGSWLCSKDAFQKAIPAACSMGGGGAGGGGGIDHEDMFAHMKNPLKLFCISLMILFYFFNV